MKRVFLILTIFSAFGLHFETYAQCTGCTYSAPSGGTNFNLNGNETLCITANASNLGWNMNGTGNKICVATGVVWDQPFGGTLQAGTVIDVYGTLTLGSGFNVNGTPPNAIINVRAGGTLNNSGGFGNGITINNDGVVNFTSSAGIEVTGTFILNNSATGTVNALTTTNFKLGNNATINNNGTLHFANFENEEGYLNNNAGATLLVDRSMNNHGAFINNGDFQIPCTTLAGAAGATTCSFRVGDKGVGKEFISNTCVKVLNGNVTFDGPGTINNGFEIGTGYNLTINKTVTGTNGSFLVKGGTSTINLSGGYVGTNMKFYDVNTAGNNFDNNFNINTPSNFTVSSSAGCSEAPCTPPTAVTAGSNSPVNAGSAINLTSTSTGGTSYSWSGPNGFTSTTQNPIIASATSTMAGTYTVTVLSSGTCTATATTAVVVNVTPTCTPPTAVTAGSNTPVSEGGSINLTSTSTGGTSYSWSGPNGFTSTTQNPSIASATATMAGTYTVTVLSSGTCTATATTAVVVNVTPTCTPPTAVTAGSNTPVSEGGSINLTSSSTAGTSYSWSGPNGFTSTTQNPTIASATSLMAGTYTVTVLSSGTCTATATTAVVVNVTPTCTPPTAVTAGSNSPVSEGGSINLTSSSTGGTSYSWSGPNGFTSTTQNPTIASATSLMAGTYTVTVLSSGTCTATATKAVVVNVTPTCTPPTAVTAGSNSPVTEGGSINLTSSSTGGTSYSWSGPNGFTSTTQNPSIASATATMAGTYTVTVLSSGTCTATATTAVVVNVTPTCTPPTAVTAGSNSPVTEGGSINLTSSSTGGTSYSWAGPNGFTSTTQNPIIASATSLMAGTYTVTVLSSGTCTATATTAVVVNVTPTCTPPTAVTAGSNSPVTEGGSINLTSSSTGGTSYSWAGPNGFTSTTQNPTIASATFTMAGTYTVTVLSSGTCTATATTIIIVTPTTIPPVDLALIKTVLSNDCKKQIGDNVVFKLVVKRQDLEMISVSGITVKDSLSPFLSFVSANTTKGTYDNNTKLWSGITLAEGDSAILQVTAKITATGGFYGGLLCNEAWIQTMNGTDIDSQVGNKSETEDDFARACVSVPLPVCTARGEKAELTAPAGYTSYQWLKNGQLITGATSNTYIATTFGEYTVTVNNGSCPSTGCCPIYVEEFCDCPPTICVPYMIQKTKSKK